MVRLQSVGRYTNCALLLGHQVLVEFKKEYFRSIVLKYRRYLKLSRPCYCITYLYLS